MVHTPPYIADLPGYGPRPAMVAHGTWPRTSLGHAHPCSRTHARAPPSLAKLSFHHQTPLLVHKLPPRTRMRVRHHLSSQHLSNFFISLQQTSNSRNFQTVSPNLNFNHSLQRSRRVLSFSPRVLCPNPTSVKSYR